MRVVVYYVFKMGKNERPDTNRKIAVFEADAILYNPKNEWLTIYAGRTSWLFRAKLPVERITAGMTQLTVEDAEFLSMTEL